MTALGHSFRTEIESKSFGNPTFLSRHLDALCPPTQEEDDWMEQELERARQQRGNFYKKLASSRATSVRDLDNGSRIRSASRGSTERELSGSPTGSTSSPPPVIPEPHSSWRFYTSYDNGEWKRHCVPVQKPEEDILMKSPTSEKNKEPSPAYETHLKKYRQARAALFDRPTRRFAASNSPQGELTTVRVVTHGNPGGLRNALSGSTNKLPFGGSATKLPFGGSTTKLPFGESTNKLPFGGSTPDIRYKTFREPAMSTAASLPSQYREETTTSETITTVNGQEVPIEQKPSRAPSTTMNSSPTRLRHNNLGFKEKIIIPTKYKAADGNAIKQPVKPQPVLNNNEPARITRPELRSSFGAPKKDEPSFLGSTFEKFDFSGVPLVKPTFSEENLSSKRKPVFGDTFGTSSENLAKRKPVFDSENHPMSFTENKLSKSVNNLPEWTTVQSSTPVNIETIRYISNAEKRSLPFGSPVERSVAVRNAINVEKPIPQFERSSNVIQPPEENSIRLGTENSAFSAPFKSKFLDNSADERMMSPSNGEKVIFSRIHSNISKPFQAGRSEDSVVIPVVRVASLAKNGRTNAAASSPSLVSRDSFGGLTDILTGLPVLELEEDLAAAGSIVNGSREDANSDSSEIRRPNLLMLQSDSNDRRKYSPLSDRTNASDLSKENQNNNERVIEPTVGKTKPIFPKTSEPEQKVKPLFTSSLQNLSPTTISPSVKTMEVSPTGEKIIIPSKYRQKPAEQAAATPSKFVNSGCSSTPDISMNKDSWMTSSEHVLPARDHDLTQSWSPQNGHLGEPGDVEMRGYSPPHQRRREKPVFPDFSNSAPDISRIPKPFTEDHSARCNENNSNLKEGNDSALSMNPDEDSFVSSPESRRNESGEIDSGIWKDPDGKPME